jgi:hypothetical protein
MTYALEKLVFNSDIFSYSPTTTVDKMKYLSHYRIEIDHLRNRLNFDLNKSRQKFHHSLKEHHKISNIPKSRCEML